LYKLAHDGKIIFQEENEKGLRCRVELSEEALQRWSGYLEDRT
jgi:hypothetical protein